MDAIHYIKKSKQKKHIIMSRYAEKVVGKI